jgi:hypothetical protein
MNVALLANSNHLSKTKSIDFFIHLLQDWFGAVSVIPHKEAWSRIPGTKWDLLVVWQGHQSPSELEAFGARSVVLIPMYDDSAHDKASWDPYLGFKVLSFSQTLGQNLISWGHDCLVVQYFQPVPSLQVSIEPSRLKGFFWPRTPALTWKDLRPRLEGIQWESFHLHLTSPEGGLPPDSTDIEQFKIVQTKWFERVEEYQKALSSASVFFAPRLSEGIGMAFLEAMALGMCVVAPNYPTMSEYIEHGVNGLLYDPLVPETIDLSIAQALGARARLSSEKGRAAWELSLPRLQAFLAQPMAERQARKHLLIKAKGHLITLMRRVFRWIKRSLGRD